MAEAATAFGATFEDACVKRQSWGFSPGADQRRILQAFRDLRSFRSSLRLFAYEIGAWHVRISGTLMDMSLGWIMNYLFQCLRLLAPVRSLSMGGDYERSSSSESEITLSPADKETKAETPAKGRGRSGPKI